MTIVKSMIIAFSMYSRIPMPKVDWSEKNMKYSLCFFPLIGMVLGAVWYGVWNSMKSLGLGTFVASAVLTVVPVLITGGIHMDGFLDTVDALASHQPKERRLAILKDSHTGAFAVIGGIVYMLLYAGGVSELNNTTMCLLVSVGFVLSRALSALSLVIFKSAKKEGLLYTFSSASKKAVTCVALSIILLICIVGILMLQIGSGCLLLLFSAIIFIYYRLMSYEKFGGITGDLAGFFLQMCELAILYAVVIGGRLGGI